MTLQEALEVGVGKAQSPWTRMKLESAKSRTTGQTLGVLLVEEHGESYTIIARGHPEEEASYNCKVPGWDELCMTISGPPLMALTQKGWQPAD